MTFKIENNLLSIFIVNERIKPFKTTLTREYKIISCSSHVYDLPTGVGNNGVLCSGVDNFTYSQTKKEEKQHLIRGNNSPTN